jgi:ABC-type oligopeptide transport system ATPase subunit
VKLLGGSDYYDHRNELYDYLKEVHITRGGYPRKPGEVSGGAV